ncbi:hypothetical protein MtrunA17_Chr5g0404261 [Medicago truncatula]|uniref:Uncharacterized protein n=1 Tax=Medicago truncatula TaxID=3880 RepID=A0A072UCP2_MEDTR|nr:hypothetical protein MTR_5g020465 [Medicago truncatula]RHN54212.1 hypothetical protein MtrunA17_Chr5g0404261 [Medicago truncatula]
MSSYDVSIDGSVQICFESCGETAEMMIGREDKPRFSKKEGEKLGSSKRKGEEHTTLSLEEFDGFIRYLKFRDYDFTEIWKG